MNAQDRTKIIDGLNNSLDEIQRTMTDGRNRHSEIVRNRGLIKELLIRLQGAMGLALLMLEGHQGMMVSVVERYQDYHTEIYQDR